MSDKTKKIIPIVVGIVPSILALLAAMDLIICPPGMVDHFTVLGFADYMKYMGSFLALIVILFWIPKTSKIALLLLTGYFGGALAQDIGHKSNFGVIIIILVLFWVAAYLKDKSSFVVSSERK